MSDNPAFSALIERLSQLSLATQYAAAVALVDQALIEGSIGPLTAEEQFYLRSGRCRSLYFDGSFAAARDATIQLLNDRERAGTLDLNYLEDIRTFALSRRGLCEFDECRKLLMEARRQLRKVDPGHQHANELLASIEQDLDETESIERDEPITSALAIHTIEVHGNFGTETIGVDDLQIPRSQCALTCRVHRLVLTVEQLHRVRMELELSIDNEDPLLAWDGNEESTTPVLFGVVHSRGGKVHHGAFDLRVEVNSRFLDREVSLTNSFLTVIHPASFQPRSHHPIPDCKSYRYIKADCSIFRSPLPAKARIRFDGWIDLPPPPGDCSGNAFARKLWLLFPFGRVVLPTPKIKAPSDDGFRLVGGSFGHTAFRHDRTGFRAGEYIAFEVPSEPALGATTPFVAAAGKAAVDELQDMDLLAIEVLVVSEEPVLATVRTVVDVIPVGICNYFPILQSRRDPASGDPSVLDLSSENSEKNVKEARKPLATVLLENYSETSRRLQVAVESEALGFRSQAALDLAPWQRASLPILPLIDQVPPIFCGWRSSADVAESTRDCDLRVNVVQAAEPAASALISKVFHAKALPPDFMVWTLSEPTDGRMLDLRLLISRWVTPQAAAVQETLRKSGLESPSGDPVEDLGHLYQCLQALQMDYDMSRIPFGVEMEYRFQRIRTPTVALKALKMNCIDGCILFASLMEALGYLTAIVFLPGHAIFAVLEGTLEAVRRLLLLETTMVCRQDGGHRFSLRSAMAAGFKQFAEHEQFLVSGESSGKGPTFAGFPLHRIVPVALARQLGVEPFEDMPKR
ncbi:MAG TPA: hypothetical protein VGM86_17225 [Thermoanaerobaculia bacterium]|jgi:hypothetical protein